MSVLLRFIILIFFALSTAAAHAEEVVRESKSHEALAHGHRGLENYKAGRFALAEEDFRAAEALAHSPVFLLYQARSQREQGRLLSARKLLRKCIEEEVSPSTPHAWKVAVDEAGSELSRLGAEIPTLSITLTGGFVPPVALRAGSATMKLEDSRADWELDPGLYEVVARDASGTEVILPLLLQKEQDAKLEFSFPEVSGSVRTFPEVPRMATRNYKRGAHAAFVLGASGLIFSAVAGTIAWSEAERIKRNCDGTSCRPEDEEHAHNARRWANLSTVGATVGAIGVGTGVGLLFYPSNRGGSVGIKVAF